MLDPTFPCYTPGSRRLCDFEGAGDQALLTAEVRRSVPPIVSAADNRVAKGQQTPEEADRLAAIWRAIAADLEALDAWRADRWRGSTPYATVPERLALSRAENLGAWSDKVAALRREIEARRANYPALVAKGSLTRDQAHAQLERLEAVHDLYWRHGFAFDGTRDELRAHSEAVTDADVARMGAARVGIAA